MSEPTTVAELKEAQVAEYGTYVARQPIFIHGVRAFNAGDPVPVSHVKRRVVAAPQVTEVKKKSTDEPKG